MQKIKELQPLALDLQTGTFDFDDELNVKFQFGDEVDEQLVASPGKVQSLVASLSSLECWRIMESRLRGALQLTIDKLAAALPINALSFNGSPDLVDMNSSLSNNVSLFIRKDLMQEPMKQVAKVFVASTKEEDPPWHAEALRDLIRKLISAWPEDCFDVTLAKFAVDEASATSCRSKEDLLQVLHLVTLISHLAMTLAWVEKKLSSSGDDACLREHRLKVEVERAISWMRVTMLSELDWMKSVSEDDVVKLDSYSLVVPFTKYSIWMRGFEQLLPLLCRTTVKILVSATSTLAGDVDKCTPGHNHIVMEDRINIPLAKKNLLGWNRRDALTTSSVNLFHCMAACSRLYEEWGVGRSKIEEDPDFEDATISNLSVFGSAKQAVSIIAALNVICDLQGQQQKASAVKLLSSASDHATTMPKSIMDKLEAISGEKAQKGEKAPRKGEEAETALVAQGKGAPQNGEVARETRSGVKEERSATVKPPRFQTPSGKRRRKNREV